MRLTLLALAALVMALLVPRRREEPGFFPSFQLSSGGGGRGCIQGRGRL